MKYILHDISVALWALRTNHCEQKETKVAVRWPIIIQRARPTYNGAWLIEFRRPMLYMLNSYRCELDYMLANSPDKATD